MDLGVRQIRTAGKGSGSIELTLPADLRDLVGLPCRIILRDGSRPDIVLQPDLERAHLAFAAFWHFMTRVVTGQERPPVFPLAAFGFGLNPPADAPATPFLNWRDGLALATSPPHDAGAVSRTVAALAHAMAHDLAIDPALGSGFGAACGYLLTGEPASGDCQEARDLASLHFPSSTPPLTANQDALGPDFWVAADPLLGAIVTLFASWTADPAGHTRLRAAWRRSRTAEIGGD